MYTVIITRTDKELKVPAICFDGKSPLLVLTKEAAEEHLKFMQKAFPEAVYKLAKIEYV